MTETAETRHPEGCAFCPVIALFWLPLICMQTWLIARREELDRPRPDYSLIAAMEREVYGEAFKHEGAPARSIPPPHPFPSGAILPREAVRCYCNYCRGCAGIHNANAVALYRAEAAVAMQMCKKHDEGRAL